MAKQIWKGGALLAPLPAVLVSCKGIDRDGRNAENVFTVAWTGIVNTIPPKTYISVRKSRYSHDIIKNSGEFVINVPTAAIVKSVDYCGIYTGMKVDKFEKCGLTREAAAEVSAPCIAECPLCLECRVTDIVEMGTHDMFVADILCTRVDDSTVDGEGKLRLDRAGLMAFAHGEYFELGRKLGEFGYSARKKSKGKNNGKGAKKSAEGKKDSASFARKDGQGKADKEMLYRLLADDWTEDAEADVSGAEPDVKKDGRYKKHDREHIVKNEERTGKYGSERFAKGKGRNDGAKKSAEGRKDSAAFARKDRHGKGSFVKDGNGENKRYGKDTGKKLYKGKVQNKKYHGKKEKL